ncbi:hypothetical protein HPULCUR_002471 [Helicostylum pulchrum]|uniref:Uncharacterized protein n=1 Tax=Helicostylum pulchrum TaxID=562976 RepID=A0ABP9XSN1_9FUNG
MKAVNKLERQLKDAGNNENNKSFWLQEYPKLKKDLYQKRKSTEAGPSNPKRSNTGPETNEEIEELDSIFVVGEKRSVGTIVKTAGLELHHKYVQGIKLDSRERNIMSIAHNAETTLMVFGSSQTTSVTSRFGSTSVDLLPSNLSLSNIPNGEGISKTLAQTTNLASDHVGQLNTIDMSLESDRNTLKANTTQEKYDHIMASIKPKEVQLSDNVKRLIDGLKSIQIISSRNMRNALYKHGYNPDYDLVADADTGIIENLTRHL